MLTLRPAWEWDIAAGALIAAEAGARVTDRHGAALRFNAPHPQTAGDHRRRPGAASRRSSPGSRPRTVEPRRGRA